MFFYLIKNNYISFIENNEDNINILVYGCMFYIIAHLLLVNLINSLSIYFWIILCSDCLTMYLLFNKIKNNKIEINDNFEIKNYDSEAEVNNLIDSIVNEDY